MKAFYLALALALLWFISLNAVYTRGYKAGLDWAVAACIDSPRVQR